MNDEYPIYRIVDGKHVRIPVRDPKHRYSLTGLGDETIHLEFTDEQEKQRDEEEAAWEAERPQREAEQKRQQEEAESFRASLQYEVRVVAFLDVLGWGDAVARSVNDAELTRAMGVAVNSIRVQGQAFDWGKEHGMGEWPGDPRISQFSDSIVLSMRADNNTAIHLPRSLFSLVRQLMEHGFLVRGGITTGQLIHRGSMTYGPALVRAYQLESKIAVHPRIILDQPLAQTFGQGMKYINKDRSLIGQEKTWRQDVDGWSYYDYLQPFMSIPGIEHTAEYVTATLRKPRQVIVDGLKKYRTDIKVLDKYRWAARYFNNVLSEYPQCNLERINTP